MWKLFSLAAHAAFVSCHNVPSLNFSLAWVKEGVVLGYLPCHVTLPLQYCVMALDTQNEADSSVLQ